MTSWTKIKSEQDIDSLLTQDKPVVFYKHSPTCGISAMVRQRLEGQWKKEAMAAADTVMIDVLSQRPLSQYLAAKTDIRHESPQVIVMRQGHIVYAASHAMIDYSTIEERIQPQRD